MTTLIIPGKVEKDRWKKAYKSPHALVMSKFDRKNHAKQIRQLKTGEHERSTSIFAGNNAAPRIVAVVPLTTDATAKYAISKLNASLDIEDLVLGQDTVRVERFKQSLQYIAVDLDLFTALDACRVADYVVFVLSSEQEVGPEGEHLLRAIENQGISTTMFVVQGLDGIEPVKKRAQVLQSLKSYVSHFFPTQEKIHSLDVRQECSNVMRSLCTSTPKGVRWREDRTWMLVEKTHSADDQMVLTSIVRGRGLKANRLLQVGDWGAFQIQKVVSIPAANKKRKVEEMAEDEPEEVLEQPDEDQDDPADLAIEEVVMDDDFMPEDSAERKGVLLDDHHYFEDDIAHLPKPPKRVPKGTSNYQSAWYLGDEGDSGSDWEDEQQDTTMELDDPAQPQDGVEGFDTRPQLTEGAPSEYPQSEMFLDPSPNDEAEQIDAYRSSRKTEAKDDLEFPDEIELHPNVLARERLAKYRGLKSLRTSHWNMKEDRPYQPDEWSRLLQVSNHRVAKGSATREALVGGIPAGTRVQIYLRNVPISLQQIHDTQRPLVAFVLLRHEQKRTVVNYLISLNSDHPAPLKSKDELILQCGPRRMIINPIFSAQGNTPNDVHKFDRYLHPGRTAIATFTAPVTWGPVPALFFQRNPITGTPLLIATGTAAPPSTSRIIAKRIILTGHPYKINRKLVTVRYMFFNAEDIAWFKALQLWTKRGRSGFVKESLGTHGYFKATFDGKINPQDAIGVSLYKRVWPRMARMVTVGDVEGMRGGNGGEEGMIQ